MPESSEHNPSIEAVETLPSQITRTLILISGRDELSTRPLDEDLVANQKQFGKDTDDYAAMVSVHQSNAAVLRDNSGTEKYLGIHEEVRRKVRVMMSGKPITYLEETPDARNIWVGDNVQLLTPDQAANTPYGGRTALDWAKAGGKTPEMVVRASNGYFYPANAKDIVVPESKR
jgi:hypothetical protein